MPAVAPKPFGGTHRSGANLVFFAMGQAMRAVEIADKLHQQAGQIIYHRGLDAVLRTYGRVFYTGSYYLNLMAWPDIDIHMILEPDPLSLHAFFEMGSKIAKLEGVFSVKFANHIRRPVAGLPQGFYWGIRLDTGDWQMPWKIDIWATDEDDFTANQASMERFREALDEEKRRLIVEVKRSLLTPEGRTPVLSGYHIYEAVLFKGLQAEPEIRAYLKEQGIEGI